MPHKSVRAKFTVSSVERFGESIGERVTMYPVYSPEGENKDFWDTIPNGKLEMTINNTNAQGFFQPDQEFYLDFTPAQGGEE